MTPFIDSAKYLLELRKNRLAVWRDADQRWQPIPAALSPVTISKKDWGSLTQDARLILSAFPVLHGWLQKTAQQSLFQMLYGDLPAIEQEGARLDAALNWGHATIRFDLFWHHGNLKVIEANCTIPAMQAYSDLIFNAWTAAGGIAAPRTANTSELLQSLLALYRRDQGAATAPVIGILHRPGDSQLAELCHYEKTWPDSKVTVLRIHPDDIAFKKSKMIDRRSGNSIDLIYRHAFGWRMDDHPDLRSALLENKRTHIYNPLSAHYEVKGFFALLSHVCQDAIKARSIGLSAEQIRAVQVRVPATRLVSQTLPDALSKHLLLDDDHFEKHIDRYVIKKSVGYGGHQVFMGSEWYEPALQARIKTVLTTPQEPGSVSPRSFLNWLHTASKDLWIIQDRMTGKRHQTEIIQGDDSITEINGFVDASIFLNTGTMDLCGGGVSRIATGPVVNIGTGGGLAPLLIE